MVVRSVVQSMAHTCGASTPPPTTHTLVAHQRSTTTPPQKKSAYLAQAKLNSGVLINGSEGTIARGKEGQILKATVPGKHTCMLVCKEGVIPCCLVEKCPHSTNSKKSDLVVDAGRWSVGNNDVASLLNLKEGSGVYWEPLASPKEETNHRPSPKLERGWSTHQAR